MLFLIGPNIHQTYKLYTVSISRQCCDETTSMLSLIYLTFELLVWYVLNCLDIVFYAGMCLTTFIYYFVLRTSLLGSSFKLNGLPQLEKKEFLIFVSPSNFCYGLTPYILVSYAWVFVYGNSPFPSHSLEKKQLNKIPAR